MADPVAQAEVRVGAQGRLVIPAPIRRALGIREGEALVVRAEGGRIVVERPEAIWQRLRGRFAALPAGAALAAELIAERRAEARREEARERESR